VQFVVDDSKSGARIANGAAAISQPRKRSYFRMARPCVGPPICASASLARRCTVAGGDAPREPPPGRRPRATNELEQFEVHRTVGDRGTAILARAVSVHAGAFGDACEEWEGAPMTGLPGSISLVVAVPCRPDCRPVLARRAPTRAASLLKPASPCLRIAAQPDLQKGRYVTLSAVHLGV
jgi:hypothetical protein